MNRVATACVLSLLVGCGSTTQGRDAADAASEAAVDGSVVDGAIVDVVDVVDVVGTVDAVDVTADTGIDAGPSDTGVDTGTVVDTGGTVDVASEAAVDAGPTGCGSTCADGQVCVGRYFEGGACLAPEDGGCPAGRVLTGPCCTPAPTFTCVTRPAACGPTQLTCACAASTLCTTGENCSMVGGEIDCTLLAP